MIHFYFLMYRKCNLNTNNVIIMILNRSVTNVSHEGDTIEEDHISSNDNSVITQTEPEIENVSSVSTFEPVAVAEKSEKESTSQKRSKKTELVDILNKRSEERIRLMQELTKTEEPEDSIDIFFKSMSLTVKQFSPELKIKAKMDVLIVINELERQNLKSLDQTGSTSNYVFPENINFSPQALVPINYTTYSTHSSELDGSSSESRWTENFHNN